MHTHSQTHTHSDTWTQGHRGKKFSRCRLSLTAGGNIRNTGCRYISHKHTYTNIHIHTHSHTQTHTHSHRHTHAQSLTHTHTQSTPPPPPPLPLQSLIELSTEPKIIQYGLRTGEPVCSTSTWLPVGLCRFSGLEEVNLWDGVG